MIMMMMIMTMMMISQVEGLTQGSRCEAVLRDYFGGVFSNELIADGDRSVPTAAGGGRGIMVMVVVVMMIMIMIMMMMVTMRDSKNRDVVVDDDYDG
jgi:hypothetical protein